MSENAKTGLLIALLACLLWTIFRLPKEPAVQYRERFYNGTWHMEAKFRGEADWFEDSNWVFHEVE